MFSRCSSNSVKPLDHVYDVCKNHISVGQGKKMKWLLKGVSKMKIRHLLPSFNLKIC